MSRLGLTAVRLSAAGALALIAAAGYYVNEVRMARVATPSLVAETWQRFGARLQLTDLSEDRRGWLLAIEDPASFLRLLTDASPEEHVGSNST